MSLFLDIYRQTTSGIMSTMDSRSSTSSSGEESGSESDISLPDSEPEEDTDLRVDDVNGHQPNHRRPMVRGPWVQVLDTDHFEHLHETGFHAECGPVNPPGRGELPITYFDRQLGVGGGGVDLYDLLVRETNRYAEQYLQDHQPTEHSRVRSWTPVTRDEMRAFLGLLLTMGLVRKPIIESYWNEGVKTWMTRTTSFGEVMTRNRFQLILRFLHCNNNTTAVPRGHPTHDPLHKIRPVLDLVNGSFAQNYGLAQNICVDERMVGFKGRSHLVQYMAQKKSHRWGVKMWILAEAGTGYTHQVRIYLGKTLGGPPAKNGLGYSVVMDLMEPHLDKGHHIVCDNYFCSPALCHALFDRGTFCTGVVTVRRRGMPSSFVGKAPPKGSTFVRKQGPLLAVLFSDRKVVSFLTTMGSPRFEATTNSRGVAKTLPSVVTLYNRTMGGVDLGDQLITLYDPQVRSVKLWKKVLINLLLTASVNAYQVFMASHGKTTSRLDFQTSLVTSLVGTHRDRKAAGRPRTAAPSRRMTGPHFMETLAGQKRKWCVLCRQRQRQRQSSSGRVRTWCPVCKVGLCRHCFRQYHTVNHTEE